MYTEAMFLKSSEKLSRGGSWFEDAVGMSCRQSWHDDLTVLRDKRPKA